MASVMLIDDSEILREQVRTVLTGAGHAVTEADGGPAALSHISDGYTPDVILVDYNMPDMDGIELTARLRQVDRLRTVPIIMVTTESSKEMKERGKQAGIQAWIVKPVSPDRLI